MTRTLIAHLLRGRTTFSRAVLHAVGNGEIQSRFAQDLLALSHVGSFHANDDGQLQLQFRGGGDDAGGQHIAAQDAAENIDEDGFHFGIADQNAESVFDLLGGSAAADVEEIGRRAAGELDDVHGGHGQARAVDHAADVAVELDVVEPELRGFHFERIFFVEIAQFARVPVAVERVVVESHLGVERDELPSPVTTSGLISSERRVGFDEGAIERLQKWASDFGAVGAQGRGRKPACAPDRAASPWPDESFRAKWRRDRFARLLRFPCRRRRWP